MNREQSGTREPMRRVGLIDQAAARFREEVVSGRWPVGERIPTEAALVAEFGIGRNTVREALQSLVHAGLRPETTSSRNRAAAWSMSPTRRSGSRVSDCSGFIP